MCIASSTNTLVIKYNVKQSILYQIDLLEIKTIFISFLKILMPFLMTYFGYQQYIFLSSNIIYKESMNIQQV